MSFFIKESAKLGKEAENVKMSKLKKWTKNRETVNRMYRLSLIVMLIYISFIIFTLTIGLNVSFVKEFIQPLFKFVSYTVIILLIVTLAIDLITDFRGSNIDKENA